jgi:biopolymer transport protein ExbD
MVSITIIDRGNNKYEYYVGRKSISFSEIEPMLQEELKGQTEPVISLYANPTVTVDQLVSIMNIAKRNQYKVLLATSPE